MITALELLAKAGKFLAEHPDLVVDVIDVLEAGTPKDAIEAAIRALKVQASDVAMKEELGLP